MRWQILLFNKKIKIALKSIKNYHFENIKSVDADTWKKYL